MAKGASTELQSPSKTSFLLNDNLSYLLCIRLYSYLSLISEVHWDLAAFQAPSQTPKTCWKCLRWLNLLLLLQQGELIQFNQTRTKDRLESILCFRSLLMASRPTFTLGAVHLSTFPLLQFLGKAKDAAVYFKKQVVNPTSSEFNGLMLQRVFLWRTSEYI